MFKNKYTYLYVLQGRYGYGWEDLASECKSNKYAYRDIKQTKKEYRDNEKGYYRIISRRELNLNQI